MEILINLWIAANFVFGLQLAKNSIVYLVGTITGRNVRQHQVGWMIDRFTAISIITYFLTFGLSL